MLRVSATFDVEIRSFAHFLAEIELEGGEICDCAVVHEAVSAEDEGVIVDWDDRRSTCCSDVSHENPSLRVCTYRAVVQIVGRRLYALIHGRSQALFLGAIAGLASIAAFEVGVRGSVPDESYAVDVVYYIASDDEVILGDVPRMVCYQAWEIVLMNLVCERVLGRNDYIFEKTWLCGRDVRELASYCQSCRVALPDR